MKIIDMVTEYSEEKLFSELKKVTELYPQERINKIYPLTPMQEGMLYHKLLDENATSYVLQDIVEVEGEISSSAIKEAVTKTVEKYDVLRTRFIYRNLKQPMQIVLKDAEYKFREMELPKDDREEIVKLGSEDVRRGFDLETESPVRVTLIKAGDKTYMIWLFHHIIVDGWSISLILGEFTKNCRLLNCGEEVRIKADEAFSEYVKWIRSQDKEAGMEYYRSLLDGYDNVAEIKSLKEGAEKDNSTKLKEFSIEKELYAEIDQYCKEHDITVNTVLETAIGILLQKYTRSKDAVFGKVVSGRNAAIENIDTAVGLFINTIPVRVSAGNNASCEDVVKAVQRQSVESTSYHYMPLADIQSASDVGDGLIKVALAFENYYVQEAESGEEESPKLKFVSAREETNYDITFIVQGGDTLIIGTMYNENAYTDAEIDMITVRLKMLMEQIVTTPKRKVSELELISDAENDMILNQFNKRDNDEIVTTVYECFRNQVVSTPDRVAVKDIKNQLTYAELDHKSDIFANILVNNGVQKDDVVAIISEKSINLIVGLLAIVKVGAIYLPIDKNLPKERIDFVLKDANAKLLLCGGIYPETDVKTVDLFDVDESGIEQRSIISESKPSDAIYIIYTSGTTGLPKGVVIENKSVIRLVKESDYCDFHDLVLLQTGAVAFDASTFEIWGPLLNGGTVVLRDNDVLTNPALLKKTIEENNVNTMWITASLFNQLIQTDETTFDGLKQLLSGGEKLSNKHVAILKNHNHVIHFHNGYGPTETTTFALTYEVEDPSYIPIGKPIGHTQVYIMEDGKLCGIGMPGELCIGGAGVARGYLNRTELTEEKFIDNPFGKGKLYRSGDMTMWMPDGNIVYLGRIDEQVKIRGFRIEITDIEKNLMEQEEIKEAAVIVKRDAVGEAYLEAFVVGGEGYENDKCKEKLRAKLPGYMIPANIYQLDRLPVTSNGKVNKKALMAMEVTGPERKIKEPRTDLEREVLDVFRDVLKTEQISIDDNFFELGGHSLRAVRLVNMLEKLSGVRLKIKDIFELNTIENICQAIKATKGTGYEAIPKAKQNEAYVVSPAQRRMYIDHQKDETGMTYNIPMILKATNKLDVDRMRIALKKLVDRHEALRTSFFMNESDIF